MSIDFALFEKRLIETMTFCHHLLKEKTDHAILWDALKDKSDFLTDLTVVRVIHEYEYDLSLTAKTVFDTRSKYLETLGIFGEPPIDKNGSLVIYFPDLCFSEGSAEICSHNYYDFLDCPPYATWVYYVEGNQTGENWYSLPHIIAWVPSEFLDLAKEGPEMTWSGVLVFLDDEEYNPVYKSQLQKLFKELGK